MKPSVRTRLAISIAAIALIGAACGSDDSSDDTEAPAASASAAVTTAPAAATTEAPATTAGSVGGEYGDPATTAPSATGGADAAKGVSVELSDTSLGEILTSDGLTLYMFTPDEGGTPTCVDACAGAWPPLLGSAGSAGPGVDADQLTVVDRPDGTKQLAYAGWPLYFYAEDQAAGAVTGQGVGDKWYVLGADGAPITS
jgi:predicted lipoprotein with Yx(FWY)xxD motif